LLVCTRPLYWHAFSSVLFFSSAWSCLCCPCGLFESCSCLASINCVCDNRWHIAACILTVVRLHFVNSNLVCTDTVTSVQTVATRLSKRVNWRLGLAFVRTQYTTCMHAHRLCMPSHMWSPMTRRSLSASPVHNIRLRLVWHRKNVE